jgi:hypothetical protein
MNNKLKKLVGIHTRYYFVSATTRDGEFEYRQNATYISQRDVSQKEMEKFADEWFGYKGSYQEVELDSWQEIPKTHYDILKKYGI